MGYDPTQFVDLLMRCRLGDQQALGELVEQYRERLTRLVALRLDVRLRRRVDASDVVQDAFLEASARLAEYARDPCMPLFLWLRFLTTQKILQLHRRHLGAQSRDVAREVSLYTGSMPEATSSVLAAHMLSQDTSPSQRAVRTEMQLHLQRALEQLDPVDREIIALRHFEQLSNAEAAQVLGMNQSTASTRHLRALKRLKSILDGMPEFSNWHAVAASPTSHNTNDCSQG